VELLVWLEEGMGVPFGIMVKGTAVVEVEAGVGPCGAAVHGTSGGDVGFAVDAFVGATVGGNV
jgi:hypothetical protein